MSKILLLFIFVVTIVASITLYMRITGQNQPLISPSSQKVTATPSPVPFVEMTIPYLRNKEYKSKLGELEKISEESNYTSYLTSYKSDGLKINGFLTKPNGEMPEGGWPAIVFVHGYIPPETYQTLGKQYSDYVSVLARNGFVVYKIDLRGHGDSEGESNGAYYSPDYIFDVLNAYAALQTSDVVNPKKIGLWGHSMAGNVLFRAFAAKPEIPAVVIWSGAGYTYSDLQKYGIDDNSYRPPPNNNERQRKRQELRDTYGDFNLESDFWKQVTPANYLNDLKGSIQINHAVDDNVVNIGYSRDLMLALDKTSITHELNEYQTGGHNITGTSFTFAMQKTVEFFKIHLVSN